MIYDNLGNRTEVQDGIGKEDSTYDAENRLTRRVYYQGTSTEVVAVQEAYDALNELATLNRYYGSGPEQAAGTTNYSYDDNMGLTNLQHFNGSGSSIANYTYTYDAASNVLSETRNGTNKTYFYDAANELINESGATTFTYDATGNRTNTGYATSFGNQLSTDGTYSYTYDANGNEVTKTNIATGDYWTYGYDDRNEMISAVDKTSGNVVETSAVYKYDALGNRTEKDVTQSGTTVVTKFILDGWKNANAHLMGNANWDVLASRGRIGCRAGCVVVKRDVTGGGRQIGAIVHKVRVRVIVAGHRGWVGLQDGAALRVELGIGVPTLPGRGVAVHGQHQFAERVGVDDVLVAVRQGHDRLGRPPGYLPMNYEYIQELLNARPFQPFVVHHSSGAVYPVRYPGSAH